MACPWDGFTRAPADFCEASLCSWIRQPSNTWSNAGFLVAAAVIFFAAGRRGSRHLRGLAYVSLATGLGSGFFHASETFVGRIADYAGMYLGAAYMLSVNVRRWRMWSRGAVRILFWSVVLGLLAAMIVVPKAAQGLYIAETTACCVGLELYLFIKQGKTVRYGWLAWYWGIFFVAYAFWWLDAAKIVCNPDDHVFQGHAVWHLLDAVALYVLFRYYEQFRVLRYEESGTR